ncbi:nucleotidyltransferase family protein [Psychroserpens ponticola]|uniref:Nucleotidyltransferase family protein n=1 Tax=Psychroserpens ponticola TaxID=2932268 RepID=A0ABY7RVI7_9FLAO|nr:nucleotidyltransferase family protein [Psychroserpens ponticola]WCO01154.1 nucleotidyltransferase family protein [Psychroserpens ponticola]
MSFTKNSYKNTLQLIADILSYENSIETLKQDMISNTINWEQFVYIASDYLVLTTCYCRLKDKNLLQYLPEELVMYLDEITTINRNRNNTLLNEIKSIADILNTNKIDFVFLKGSAFLIKNLYQDVGERMLGDIDILVDEDQIDHTYQLLLKNDYTGTDQGISAKYFDNKHLPRLQSKLKLAAVEVHRKVVIKSYNGVLDVKDILEKKESVQNIYVPSKKHLVYHTILNFQANDSGYIYSRISYKSIYDLLILKKAYNFSFDKTFNPSYFKNYFSIAKIFFNDFSNFKSKTLINYIFLQKLKHPFLRKFIDSFLSKFQFIKTVITTRIGFFIKNRNYRRDIINKYK